MSLQYHPRHDVQKKKRSRSGKFYIDGKGKISTFVIDTLSTVDATQRKNNGKHVLDMLNKKFNPFRNGIRKDVPDESVGNMVKRTLYVNTFLDFIHTTDRPAIVNPSCLGKQSQNHITHSQMHNFIKKSFNLAKFNLWRGDRVAICLPEGPALNLCLLSTMAYCTCVPSNFKLTADELLNDYKQLKVKAVIVPQAKLMSSLDDPLINRLRGAGFKLIGLKTTSDTDIRFTLAPDPIIKPERNNNDDIINTTASPYPSLNEANDVVILIQTSGTTGQKKIVPYRLQTLCISTICVIYSLDVKDTDTIINMMPLFHVGGIIRNLLTPVFSGGSIIQCQGFDPVQFCDILETHRTNQSIWFYGVPSMQQNIVQVAAMRNLPPKSCDLVKKICNAGAALAPSLAKEIKSIFTRAVILPSYGMTECMPICAPPTDYGLELEGTSGQVIGPELAIFVDDKITLNDKIIGHIMVRGSPSFDGYEGVDYSETFDKNGFFDTGDMGYLKNGNLYITGRSKEVINRGGEILSPLEIENILISHPKISAVMVFSVPHDTLQETVGCAIVTREPHIRPDLRSLRKFLDKKLHPSKHPQLLVYMNEIPKNNVGKVLRIDFSKNFNIPSITNAMEMIQSELLYELLNDRTSETTVKMVEWSVNDVVETVKRHPQIKTCAAHRNGGKFFLFIVNAVNEVEQNNDDDDVLVRNIENYLRSNVHDYMLPTDIIKVEERMLKDWQSVDEENLANLLKQQQKEIDDEVTLVLCDIFGLAIGLTANNDENANKFPADGNFFEYGGNSLKNGFLISTIHTKLGVALPASTLYEEDCQTPAGLAIKCRERMPKDHFLLTHGYEKFRMRDGDAGDCQKTFQNSNYKQRMQLRPLSGAKNPFNPLIMLFQACPFYLLQPMAHIFRWTVFVHVLLYVSSLHRKTTFPNLVWLLASLLITGIGMNIALPIVGILMKWLVIGRYRAGTYSLWGIYYLRWWFVNKLLLVTGSGAFKVSPTLYVLYLRLMGAKVGSNCRISCDADIHEFDLINIGSECCIDNCTIRPFRLSVGHMNLSNIVIRDGCVIAFRTNVVAGTTLVNGTCVGPQTTTYTRDLQCNGSSAPAAQNTAQGVRLRDLCEETFPKPHFLLEYLLGWPIVIVTQILSHMPWFYCLYLLTKDKSFNDCRNIANFIIYLSHPDRIGYLLLAAGVRHYFVPLLYIILVILVKRLVIGKFRAGAKSLDQFSLMKHWLMKTLLSKEKWQLISTIVGSHYEVISIIYRMLGAKVGKRVYWPGTNMILNEFDLLTVGDDVIFGSRCRILCGDAGECAPVTIEDGAMCADNCVILPGSRIGRNAILGSGGLLQKHCNLPDGSIWYGSFNGNAVKLREGAITKTFSPIVEIKDERRAASTTTIISIGNNDDNESDTRRPFGRAYYDRKANYFVFPLAFIIFYNFIAISMGTILWSIPLLGALQITALYIHITESVGAVLHNQPATYFILVLLGAFSLLNVLVTIVVLCLEIVTKWTLMGRRKPGTYNWDTSSYSQRWQFLIGVQNIVRKNATIFMGGTAWIVLFFRALGGTIGKRVCLYPNGGDPIMTEPDLVVLEDDVAVDKASLICHLNTLGEFTINRLWVGAGSVLQNDSRLAAGAVMLEDCTLMDRSYIIQGEIAEAGSVWQGYPAIGKHFTDRMS